MKINNLMSRIVILIAICILSSDTLLSQGDKRDQFIAELHLDSMSENGKDTLFFYAYNNMTNTFWLPNRITDPKPIPHAKKVFVELFSNKMNDYDLSLIENFWDKRQEEYVSKILKRESLFINSFACQNRTVDSLLEFYTKKFHLLSDEINSSLSDMQIQELIWYYQERISGYERKKKEFIDLEKEFTENITPHRVKYIEYGFKLMDKIPSSYYLNLVSGKRGKLSFIDSIPEIKYVSTYIDFQTELDTKFSIEKECRAHTAIPFYRSEIKDKRYHTILNSLLYAYLNGYMRDIELEDVADIVDWPDIENFNTLTVENLDEVFNSITTANIGYKIDTSFSSNGNYYLTKPKEMFTSLALSLYDLEEGDADLLKFASQNRFNSIQEIESDKLRIFLVEEYSVGPGFVSGFIFTEDYILSFIYTSANYSKQEMINDLNLLLD